MSLSKNQLKLITSLGQKKYRVIHNLFIAEGTKVVNEFLNSSFQLEALFCVDDSEYKNCNNITLISKTELKKISKLSAPNNVLAIFKIPTAKSIENEGLVLVLDELNDPGNLGTIIRLSDWFGVKQIVCSKNTVDCYNAKVVQASMGSLSRVNITYTDLETYLKNSEKPKFASLMEGENVYKTKLPKDAILVMGNEANGISKDVLNLLDNSVSIPRFGNLKQTESLNVATATAILLSEFKRLT
ncbi:TrmH family RNA methyltransferase [Lutibacter oceani]|uniref:TrmH family RNA methyltransferase n=1 Tax=Lutibacter oceani TaxID=1853311 RepID=A0A3D9RYN8_9FLAO|nr:RNA methyltransferase [Lutibacter oceani]REE82971.1 TrmH family RNA methyltransferase [Lutibacter oceani]